MLPSKTIMLLSMTSNDGQEGVLEIKNDLEVMGAYRGA